jgi:hypothetical protein
MPTITTSHTITLEPDDDASPPTRIHYERLTWTESRYVGSEQLSQYTIIWADQRGHEVPVTADLERRFLAAVQ